MRRRQLLTATGALVLGATLAACGTSKGAVYKDGQLEMAVIATYGTGTSTYADMAAVANTLTNEKDLNTRIITSDTAIGRMTPLRKGQATFARTGDEYIFAFEGDYDFAAKTWGPQPVRVVWGPTGPHGMLVKANSGIVNPEDLKGKKVPRVTANPSVNNKLQAFLHAGGLTWDDVEPVAIGYGEQAEALKAGKIDVLFQQVYGSSLFELESSTPVRWMTLDKGDEKAIQEIAPSVHLADFGKAPGQKEGEQQLGMIYAVPVVTYAETPEEIAYALARDFVDTYPKYKDATATTQGWSIDASMTTPVEVPFHDGMIRLLKEKNHWPAQAQAKQDELLAREGKLAEGWESLGDIPDDQVPTAWAAWKKEHLDG
ncbi:MAG: TAXI family TRAP transporter solute-binding subunit [Dermatophilus congolensis]|nr:TAXI family TRAP transporter solute-binding subunit [Dermatophilus congolensis]